MILTSKHSSKQFVDLLSSYFLLLEGDYEGFKAQLHELVKIENSDDRLFEIWADQDFANEPTQYALEEILSSFEVRFPLSNHDVRQFKEGIIIWKYLNGEISGIDLHRYCWSVVRNSDDCDSLSALWYEIDDELDQTPNPKDYEAVIRRRILNYNETASKKQANNG